MSRRMVRKVCVLAITATLIVTATLLLMDSFKLLDIRSRSISRTTTRKHSIIPSSTSPLVNTTTSKLFPPALAARDRTLLADRQSKIKAAMAFAWKNYRDRAWGADELLPVSGEANFAVWGGLAVTMVDALDTLWIMGFEGEFEEAREWIQKTEFHRLNDNLSVSVFETFIRIVGGLLGAYSVSRNAVFLKKAEEVVKLLDGSWDEDSGVYFTIYNPGTGQRKMATDLYRGNLADLGSLQLECRFLSKETGNSLYAQRGDRFLETIKKSASYRNTGLFPRFYDTKAKAFEIGSTLLTVGAYMDSFYEYLVKVWAFSGRQEVWLRDVYDRAVDGIYNYLSESPNDGSRIYLTDVRMPRNYSSHAMQDLACFVPGMIAYGTLSMPDTPRKQRDQKFAKAVGEACYDLNVRHPIGLIAGQTSLTNYQPFDANHRLRPETIESLYYLYVVTKNETYRDMGWKLFEAIETHCKTQYGYSEVEDVRVVPARHKNKMESYFLAETLKYHFLLQSPRGDEMLQHFVFNTEAHPLSIY